MSNTQTQSRPVVTGSSIFQTLADSVKRTITYRRAYNETYRELSRLTNRELADIAISRSELGRISREAGLSAVEKSGL